MGSPHVENPVTDYRYGLAQPDDVAEKTGREILQAVGDGFAAFEGEPGPHLLNPTGGVHGGWALTLIDSVVGCAGHSLLPAGAGYTTIETKGNFSRPIARDTGHVRAEGHAVAQGRQIISAEARVLAADGRVLAHGTSTLLVLNGAR